MTTNFFLGANSANGFQSLYGEFVSPEQYRDLMVLKGGPGSGKSSVMKYIGKRAEEAGEVVEYIRCSGDPESLDGVFLPRIGFAAVDGTAPHVVEPQFPAAVDRYVDLGRFYNVDALKTHREEIMTHTRAYKNAYAQAYRALNAAGEVEESLRRCMGEKSHTERLLKRAEGIIARELGKKGSGTGKIFRRFLGGMTCQGRVIRFDSVEQLAPRIYEVRDSYGFAAGFLRKIEESALARGYDVIECPRVNDLSLPEHLVIAERGVAFISTEEHTPYEKRPYRRIHADSLADKEVCRREKQRCRFYRRMQQLLEKEALSALQEAKTLHDRLEAVYNPYVDFEGVYALAEEEWQRIKPLL